MPDLRQAIEGTGDCGKGVLIIKYIIQFVCIIKAPEWTGYSKSSECKFAFTTYKHFLK